MNSDDKPIVVPVDALDEAEDQNLPSRTNRLYLPEVLPSGVFFIVTTRLVDDYRLRVDHSRDIRIDDHDPRNLVDIRQYVQNFIGVNRKDMAVRIQQWGVNEQEFIAIISEKSDGNFMYIRHILDDIHTGAIDADHIDDIHRLPHGLTQYYHDHWRLMQQRVETGLGAYYEPVICMLVLVRKPLSIKDIHALTKIEPEHIAKVLKTWSEFLEVTTTGRDGPLFSIYHRTFQAFVEQEVKLMRAYEDLLKQFAQEVASEQYDPVSSIPIAPPMTKGWPDSLQWLGRWFRKRT